MKLGFWNRLALVAGLVGSFVWPTWWVLSANERRAEVLYSGLERCMKSAQTMKDDAFCNETWMHSQGSYLGWSDWWMGVLGAALALFALYWIAWLMVWVAKWVWRGRQQQSV